MYVRNHAQSSALSRHNKTAAHIESMKSKNTNIPITQSSFVDCGETIKEEDIKVEIKEEENVIDLSPSVDYYTVGDVKEEIKKSLITISKKKLCCNYQF